MDYKKNVGSIKETYLESLKLTWYLVDELTYFFVEMCTGLKYE